MRISVLLAASADLLKEAGALFRFPPDPGRAEEPLRIHQTYELSPGF